jgi:integrase
VDLSHRLVHIESKANYRTKQGKRRTIPLSEAGHYLLSSMEAKSPAANIFTINGSPVRPDWLTHAFKKAARRAGLDERDHFHALRHTFASWLVQGGSTLIEVQKLLGHSSQ